MTRFPDPQADLVGGRRRRPPTSSSGPRLVRVSVLTIVAFAAPAVVLLAVFNVLPLIEAATGSMFDTRFRDGARVDTFTGINNYLALASDPIFPKSIWATIAFVAVTSVSQVVYGFLLAFALRTRVRGWLVYQSLLLLPLCLSIVVSMTIWRIGMDPRGVINGILESVGIPAQGFYLDPNQALVTVSLICTWVWAPFASLIFLAGLRQIDPAMIEAAEVDGASAFQRLTRVILPLMKRPGQVVLVTAVTLNFTVYAPASLLTKGGPNFSTDFLMWEAWTQSGFGRYGASYTLVSVILVLMTLSVFAIFRLMRSEA